jgi:hypothetical protein
LPISGSPIALITFAIRKTVPTAAGETARVSVAYFRYMTMKSRKLKLVGAADRL